MKSKLLSSSVAILTLSLVAAACGDDSNTTGGGGTGGDGASGATGGSGGSGGAGLQGPGGGPTVGGGGSGGMGDGNDSFAEAQEMTEGDGGVLFVDTESLDPAETDIDFYKFTAAAGPFAIFAAAKPQDDPFAVGYLDTVISIYDSAMQQVAANDDPYPRGGQDSSVYTILEAGEYFIKIEEFCNAADCGADEEQYYDDLTEDTYSLFVVPLDGADNGTVSEGAEPNSTLATATVMEYEPTTDDPNLFFLSTCIGDWTNADLVDGIRFIAPANVTVDPASRASGRIIIPPPGTSGSGSSMNPGIIEVVDTTTMLTLAKFNMGGEDDSTSRAELSFPIVLGPTQEYLIRVADGPGATGGDVPFYFLFHGVGGGNPLETQEATNSVITTPEALTGVPNGELTSSFIEGDIPTADVDFFELTVTDDTFTVTCEALRGGSGATLRVEVLSGDGMTSLGMDTESAVAGPMNAGALLIEDVDSTGETSVIVKIDKAAQAADVTGAFYRCGFHFAAPDMP